MKDYNALSRTVAGQAYTSAWLAKKSPVIYLYGHTGAGKTYSLGTLLDHHIEDGTRPYAPVLYLDGDGGSETVGERAENEELCTLVEFDGRYDDMLSWWFNKLLWAEKQECGAILVEGASALFDSMVTPEMRKITSAQNGEAWQAHNEPSRKVNTFWQAIKELSVNRKARGAGVPIFVSLNCREVGKEGAKYFIPDFSPNVTRKAMRTADGFLELRRKGSTKMLALATPDNMFRKLRRESVAKRVEAAWDLTLPGMLTLWSITAAQSRNKLTKSMAALLEATAELTEPEPEQPQPETT